MFYTWLMVVPLRRCNSVEVPLTLIRFGRGRLHYYEAKAPLTMLSELVSHDPGLDLRVEHTHGFSAHGQVCFDAIARTGEPVAMALWRLRNCVTLSDLGDDRPCATD